MDRSMQAIFRIAVVMKGGPANKVSYPETGFTRHLLIKSVVWPILRHPCSR